MYRPLYGEDGSVRCVIVEGRDVTDLESAREHAEQSAQQIEVMFEHTSGFLGLVDADGRVLTLNRAAYAASGTREEDVVGKLLWLAPWWEGLPEERTDARRTHFEALGGRAARSIVAFRAADGSIRYVDRSATPIHDGSGRVFRVLLEGLDVTERLESERALARNERRYRALFEQSNDGVLLASPGGGILAFNTATVTLPELSAKRDVVGRRVRDALGEAADALLRAAASSGRMERGEIRLGEDPDAMQTFLVSVNPIHDAEGEIEFMQILLRDVTNERGLEARLRHAQKIEAVGRMASGIAHEVNNPLTYVIGNLHAVIDDLKRVLPPAEACPGRTDLLARLHEACDGANRVSRIVNDLKSFVRVDREEIEAVDVGAVVEHAVRMAWNQIRFHVRVVRELAPVPPVKASFDKLLQVFLNLVMNAAQAIEAKGEPGEITIRSRRDEGAVVVEFHDTGSGVPAEHVEKLFDPFFTTKNPGAGTGLGLWVSRNIVAALGGAIDVTTSPAGTAFRIRLPAARDIPADEEKSHAPEVYVPSTRGRVLVVDDEPLVRSLLVKLLRADHEVVATQSAEEAFEHLERDSRFDAILCDLMMEGIGGIGFYERVSTSHPELLPRIAFVTGGIFTPAVERFIRSIPNPCLQKPFAPDELKNLIRRLVPAVAASRSA